MKKQKKDIKKCYLCGKHVKNENINKDGNYFCSNDCELKYWNNQEKTNKKQLIETIFPNLFGYDTIKNALLLSAISPEPIHILIVGDPSTGKTKILKSIQKAIRNSAYMSGNIYGRLTSTKEIAISELSRKSDMIIIDNLPSIPDDDKPIIDELMNQDSSIIASGNPKFGRFDPYEVVGRQIDLPVNIINNFDLIFLIKDLPDEESDGKIVDALLNNTKKEPNLDEFTKFREACLKKQIDLNKDAKKTIKDYYIKIRSISTCEDEYSINPVPLSLKQAESLSKLAKANALLNNKSIADKKDALEAIRILEFCLAMIGFDKKTGKIDIDRIETEFPASIRENIRKVSEAILDLENKIGKTIPVEDILEHELTKGIDEDEIEDTIDTLKKKGQIFEPRHGFISRI